MNISASSMGIGTAVTRHDITAHDVANVNTKGFAERRAEQGDVLPEGVRITSIRTTPNQPGALSNTDLTEESKEQIVNKNTVAANADVIRAKDKMLGELLDIFA